MYADFLFFDRFLVVDFLPNFWWGSCVEGFSTYWNLCCNMNIWSLVVLLTKTLWKYLRSLTGPVMQFCFTPSVIVARLEKASPDLKWRGKCASCVWYPNFLMLWNAAVKLRKLFMNLDVLLSFYVSWIWKEANRSGCYRKLWFEVALWF